MENLENKNKKDFKFLDHNKIEYKSFRKEFYIEVPEIANMSPEEVAAYRVDLEGIKVLGKNTPNPIKVSRRFIETMRPGSRRMKMLGEGKEGGSGWIT